MSKGDESDQYGHKKQQFECCHLRIHASKGTLLETPSILPLILVNTLSDTVTCVGINVGSALELFRARCADQLCITHSLAALR